MSSTPPPEARSKTVYRRNRSLLLRVVALIGVGGFALSCASCSGLMSLGMLASDPQVFLLATLFATMTAVPYGLLLLWVDRNEQEPLPLVITAFLWGALVATAISGIFNTIMGEVALGVTGNAMLGQYLTASFSAPFIEELTKGLAVVVLFALFRDEFDNVLDGILYGALIGLGFAWFENITYYMNTAAMGGVEGMLKNVYARGVVSAAGGSHAAYTALTGAGFGLVRVMRRGFARWLFVPLFWGMSMFAHFAWNAFVGIFAGASQSELITYVVNLPLAVLVLQVPFLLLILVVVFVVLRHEAHLITTYLDLEPDDVVSSDDLAQLTPPRRRFYRSVRDMFTGGPGAWWRGRRLARTRVQLAFTRWHHDKDVETHWEADHDAEVLALRAKIRGLKA